MLSDDVIHKLFTDSNRAEIEAGYLAVLWLINLLLWLSGSRWFANTVLTLFASMQLFQLLHMSLTGTPLTPYDIGKATREFAEIQIALSHSLREHGYLLLAWGLPWGLLFLLFNRFMRAVRTEPSWVPVMLVIVILGSKPERAMRRDMIAFMPGPTRSSLHNSINAFSFYLARIAGRDHAFTPPEFQPYQVISQTDAQPAPDNIVVILIDSLRYDRLHINGYERNNTPFLSRLQQQHQLESRQGIASSVATGATLPLLLNVVREPGNIPMLEAQTANLFLHARKAGYKTFWLSTQESKMLHGIGVEHIDVIRTLEDDPFDIKQNGDDELVDWVNEKIWGERNFIVLLSRSVHSPYEDNYRRQNEREEWPVSDDALPLATRLSNAYDNAILNFDQILEDKLTALQGSLPGTSVVVITADHGQMLGEEGRWGHNRLYPSVAAIPMILHQWSDQLAAYRYELPDNDFISHYELGAWLLDLMDFQLINPQLIPDVHYFHGENIYENNLFRTILEGESGLRYCELTSLTEYKPSSCNTPQ